MSIDVKLGAGQSGIQVQVGDQNAPPQARMNLNARKTLDGDIVVYDHIDMDIVIMPKTKKILALTKHDMSDTAYEAQSRLFDYLKRKGVILFDSIQGGNIYGAIEALYPEGTEGNNATQAVLLTVGKFIEEERPYFM